MNDYLAKPVDPGLLTSMLERWLLADDGSQDASVSDRADTETKTIVVGFVCWICPHQLLDRLQPDQESHKNIDFPF